MYEGPQRRSWFVYAPRLDPDLARDEVIGDLDAVGVSAKPYLPCIHLQPYYREAHGHGPGEFPVTEAISASTIALPFFPEMTEAPGRPRLRGAGRAIGRAAARRAPAAASGMTDGARLWGGRFARRPGRGLRPPQLLAGVDRRLWPQDVAASRAHARMLAARGIISGEDADAIASGLDRIEDELRDGDFAFREPDEDIHTAVERRLTELVGDAGRRLHTARSRNDQVITDVLLYLRERATAQRGLIAGLAEALLRQAEDHFDTLLPGYTHGQRAQPVRLAHHLLAYVWMLGRDRARLGDVIAAPRRVPAGLGRPRRRGLPDRPGRGGRGPGFDRPSPNSLDAVGSRDALVDYLHFAAQLGVHLSRLGAEIVLWAGDEHGFVELDDAFSSGSSMLPQKKNPDAAELARAKAPRLTADLAGLLGVLHGLPLAYNKDLQEDKAYLFDAVDTVDLLLPAMTGMIATADFRRDRMAAAVTGGFLAATDLADHLVKLGWPFRSAHEAVGRLVRACLERGIGLEDAAPADLAAAGLEGIAPPPHGRGLGRGQGRAAAARPARRSSTSSTRRGRGWRRGEHRRRRAGRRPPGRAARRRVLRPPRGRGRARPGRLHPAGRRRRRPHRRDRALPAGRPGLPQLPRPARARRGHVRPPRAGSTSTAATGSTGASTWSASPRAAGRRCCCGRSPHARPRGHAGAARRPRRPAPVRGARAALPGARRSTAARRRLAVGPAPPSRWRAHGPGGARRRTADRHHQGRRPAVALRPRRLPPPLAALPAPVSAAARLAARAVDVVPPGELEEKAGPRAARCG